MLGVDSEERDIEGRCRLDMEIRDRQALVTASPKSHPVPAVDRVLAVEGNVPPRFATRAVSTNRKPRDSFMWAAATGIAGSFYHCRRERQTKMRIACKRLSRRRFAIKYVLVLALALTTLFWMSEITDAKQSKKLPVQSAPNFSYQMPRSPDPSYGPRYGTIPRTAETGTVCDG